MAYSGDWDAAFEADPADSDNVSAGASEMRKLRLYVRERLQADHYWAPAGTQADHGEHKKITFHEPIATPANVADKGFLYIKDASGKVELHWLDEDGNEVQLTNVGVLTGSIPSGTIMLMESDTAIAGWTLLTTQDDQVVYITKGAAAGGETGASAKTSGTWTQPNHKHTGPSHKHKLPVGGTASPEYTWIDTSGTTYSRTGSSWCVDTDWDGLAGQGSGTKNCFYSDLEGTGNTSEAATVNTWRPPGYNYTRQQKD